MKRKIAFKITPTRPKISGVTLVGLGAIGTEVARYILEKTAYSVIAAVDANPALVGKTLGEILGIKTMTGLRVTASLSGPAPKGAVALHMAGSHLTHVEPQITALVKAGYGVASIAEELSFPQLQHPDAAHRLDALAKEKGVAVVGVGVNPGFVMDLLPLVAAGVCQDIQRVEVLRIVDASTRREPLQRKIGSGMTPEQFKELAAQGKIGHVGLIESCALLAAGLGMEVDEIEESLTPAIAHRDIRTKFVNVRKGQVCGIHHTAVARKGETVRVSLELQMFLGADAARDEIHIVGIPEMRLMVSGGTPGDSATVAALINAIPRLATAPPGLHTIKDLPLTR